MKQPPDINAYTLTAEGSDKYADLEMALAAAVPGVVQALLAVIRERNGNGSHENGDNHSEKDEDSG